MDEEELTSYHLLLSTAKAMGNKTDESIAYKGLGCGCFENAWRVQKSHLLLQGSP